MIDKLSELTELKAKQAEIQAQIDRLVRELETPVTLTKSEFLGHVRSVMIEMANQKNLKLKIGQPDGFDVDSFWGWKQLLDRMFKP